MAARTKKARDDRRSTRRRSPRAAITRRSSVATSKRSRRTSPSGAASAPPDSREEAPRPRSRRSSRTRPALQRLHAAAGAPRPRGRARRHAGGRARPHGLEKDFVKVAKAYSQRKGDHLRRVARVRRAGRGPEEGRHHPRRLPERDLAQLATSRSSRLRPFSSVAEVRDQRVARRAHVLATARALRQNIAGGARRAAPDARRPGRARVRSRADRGRARARPTASRRVAATTAVTASS